jgi:hypothetical protein
MIEQPETKIVGHNRVMLCEDYTQAGITVPRGFIYDGASIPRFCWSLIGLGRFGDILGAATVHDWLYVHSGYVVEGYYPKSKADRIFYDLMLLSDISKLQSKLAYWAVCLFGRYERVQAAMV